MVISERVSIFKIYFKPQFLARAFIYRAPSLERVSSDLRILPYDKNNGFFRMMLYQYPNRTHHLLLQCRV